MSARGQRLEASRIDQAATAGQGRTLDLAMGSSHLPSPVASCPDVEVDAGRYPHPHGLPALRTAIADATEAHLRVKVDAARELTITCGATDGLFAVLLALLNPGDEVVLFEPFYEGFHSAITLAGARPRLVRLQRPGWQFDPGELSAAFSPRTKALILNSPHNPTGKVFTSCEVTEILVQCLRHDVVCISDEVYERVVFDGAAHISPLQFPEAGRHTIVLNSMSKSYHAAGWRVGYVLAPAALTDAVRRVHESTTYGVPAVLQAAAVAAYTLPDRYYADLRTQLQERRDWMARILDRAGVSPLLPAGGMYVCADLAGTGYDDLSFVAYLAGQRQVSAVPGRYFYAHHHAASDLVRFCFARSYEVLAAAAQRLQGLSPEPSGQPPAREEEELGAA